MATHAVSCSSKREGIRLEIQHSTVFIFIMFSFSFSFIFSSFLSIHHTSLSTIGHKKDEEDKKCDNTVNAKHYENKHGINKKEMIKDRYNKNAKAMVKSWFHYSYMER